MICPKCDQVVDDGSVLCVSCGATLPTEEAAVSDTPPKTSAENPTLELLKKHSSSYLQTAKEAVLSPLASVAKPDLLYCGINLALLSLILPIYSLLQSRRFFGFLPRGSFFNLITGVIYSVVFLGALAGLLFVVLKVINRRDLPFLEVLQRFGTFLTIPVGLGALAVLSFVFGFSFFFFFLCALGIPLAAIFTLVSYGQTKEDRVDLYQGAYIILAVLAILGYGVSSNLFSRIPF